MSLVEKKEVVMINMKGHIGSTQKIFGNFFSETFIGNVHDLDEIMALIFKDDINGIVDEVIEMRKSIDDDTILIFYCKF